VQSCLKMVANSMTVNPKPPEAKEVEEVDAALAVEPMDTRTGADSWGH
jgi:hypothetical protein